MSAVSTVASNPPVVVVGAGLAGLSAATQIVNQNVPVQLLDRFPKAGGNSIKASSGINGAPTRFQPVLDSTEAFLKDTIKSAGQSYQQSEGAEKERRERLVNTLVDDSRNAIYWLAEEQGVDLSAVSFLGGHSAARTHRGGPGSKPPGFSIVSTLLENLKKSPLFDLKLDTKVTKVIKENGEVVGVEVEVVKEKKAERLIGPVVFASGGFAGDAQGLVHQYRPDLAGYPSTNDAREGTQPLLQAIGAGVVDMKEVQVHPTGFIDPADPTALIKILAAEVLRGEGGILLAGEGERFVNEMTTRDAVTAAIKANANTLDAPAGAKGATKQWETWLVLDKTSAEKMSSHLGFYRFKKLMTDMTIGDLQEHLPKALETIKSYSRNITTSTPDPFGRATFGAWSLDPETIDESTPITAGRITPVVHFTMGGVTIDSDASVVDTEGEKIKGLWAAGEITGGLHGDNRLGGSSLLECVVFGRKAGFEAAQWWKQRYGDASAAQKVTDREL